MRNILKIFITIFENTLFILAIPFVFILATIMQITDELEEKEN